MLAGGAIGEPAQNALLQPQVYEGWIRNSFIVFVVVALFLSLALCCGIDILPLLLHQTWQAQQQIANLCDTEVIW